MNSFNTNIEIKISVIIPFKGDGILLKKLLNTIPAIPTIEVIVADNNQKHFDMSFFSDCREIILLEVDPNRGAGGARNEALKYARGLWVVFADADDFFAESAFSVLLNSLNNPADLIYFKSNGIILNSGRHSDRADYYNSLIDKYNSTKTTENDLRYKVGVPWGKMYKLSLIRDNNILFDEIVAGNDAFFSLACGYYSNSIDIIKEVLYTVTVSGGTLTQRIDFDVVKARLYSRLHCNHFLKQHKLDEYQYSIMYFFLQTCKFGMSSFIDSVKLLILFRQNPFIGCGRWFSSLRKKLFI